VTGCDEPVEPVGDGGGQGGWHLRFPSRSWVGSESVLKLARGLLGDAGMHRGGEIPCTTSGTGTRAARWLRTSRSLACRSA
jgi:hypothetical protein